MVRKIIEKIIKKEPKPDLNEMVKEKGVADDKITVKGVVSE